MNAYFAWAIILGLVWFILYIRRKDLRFEIIFSSLLFLPFGFTEPLFVPEYWNPIVLYKFFNLFYIESFLWCFFTGGISSVIYEEVFRVKIIQNKEGVSSRLHAYVIYALTILCLVFMFYIKTQTSYSVLRSSFLFMIFVYLYFIYSRPDLIKKSLISGFLFLTLYITSLKFVDLLFPGFIEFQWTIQGSIGMKLFSIVIEEYVYALLFGIVWSVVYLEIKNIKLRSRA